MWRGTLCLARRQGAAFHHSSLCIQRIYKRTQWSGSCYMAYREIDFGFSITPMPPSGSEQPAHSTCVVRTFQGRRTRHRP
jgi:hypothetical protein